MLYDYNLPHKICQLDAHVISMVPPLTDEESVEVVQNRSLRQTQRRLPVVNCRHVMLQCLFDRV
jgi:hypothetical protein